MSKVRQPWPLKWIALAILLVIVPYTFLTLRYRKPGPAFRPYEDMKNRANVSRLLAAGYQRIPISAQSPADHPGSPGGAAISTVAGGLPEELRSTLVEIPQLASAITSLVAAPMVAAPQPYVIQLTCTLPDDRQQLAGAELFLRNETLVVVPTFEPVGGELRLRSRSSPVLLTVPPGALKPGRYRVTVVAQIASHAWPLEVK